MPLALQLCSSQFLMIVSLVIILVGINLREIEHYNESEKPLLYLVLGFFCFLFGGSSIWFYSALINIIDLLEKLPPEILK
jgi:hypothetical protein